MSAQALPGLEFFGSATVGYKLEDRGRLSQRVQGKFDVARYKFSSESQRRLDDAGDDLDESDLALERLTLSYSGTYNDADKQGANTFGLTLGRTIYGGNTLSTSGGFNVGRRMLVNDKNLLNFSFGGRRDRRSDVPSRSATVWSAITGWTHIRENRDRLNFNLFAFDTVSGNTSTANLTRGVSVGYSRGKPLWDSIGVDLSLSVRHRRNDDTVNSFNPITREVTPIQRKDLAFSASGTLTFRDFEYYGFVPTATLSMSRTRSNNARYDTRDLGINFGLRSSF